MMGKLGSRTGEYRVCKTCGATFYVFPSYLKKQRFTGTYCSRPCWLNGEDGLAMKRRPRSETAKERVRQAALARPHPRRKPDFVGICEQCGREWRTTPRNFHSRSGRFCSYRCWVAYLRLHPEVTPNYVDGLGRKPYGRGWTIHLKERIMARDGFRCVVCGVTIDSTNHASIAKELAGNVHHIDRNKANHAASNLVTLCSRCHGTAHVRSLEVAWRWGLTTMQAMRVRGLLPAP